MSDDDPRDDDSDEPLVFHTSSEPGPPQDDPPTFDPCEEAVRQHFKQKFRYIGHPFGFDFMLVYYLREIREVLHMKPKAPRGRPNKDLITAACSLQQQGKTRPQIASEIGKILGRDLTEQERKAPFAGVRMRTHRRPAP